MKTLTIRRKYCVAALALLLASSVTIACVVLSLDARRDSMTMKRFVSVGGALLGYADRHNSLPPAYMVDEEGKPAHSWRVLLLPALGYQDLFDAYSFDEPWNGPNNRKLILQIPAEYQASDAPRGYTDVVAVVGKNTLWPGATAMRLEGINYATSTAVVQARTARIWTKPEDLAYEEVLASCDMGKKGSRVLASEACYVTADGALRRLTTEGKNKKGCAGPMSFRSERMAKRQQR